MSIWDAVSFLSRIFWIFIQQLLQNCRSILTENLPVESEILRQNQLKKKGLCTDFIVPISDG